MLSWLNVLRPRHFDLSFSPSSDYDVRIIERPGLTLGAAERQALRADLVAIASAALPAMSLQYGLFADQDESWNRTIITLIRRRSDGAAVAFNAMPVLAITLAGQTVEVLHLGLVMVRPDCRGHGLSWMLYGLTCFLFFLRNQFRPIWISSVTQVPAVAGMVTATFSDVFPAPHAGARRSLRHQLIARQIMAHHRAAFGVGVEAGFDADRFIITNAYTGGSEALKKSLAEASPARDEAVNAFMAAELDYRRGDDLLQIGRIDMAAARRFLSDSVPRNALGQLALASVLAFVQRLVLPVAHWFDAGRSFGILRPRKRP